MSTAVQTMLDVLNIEQLEVNLFRGRSPQDRWQRVFGGQVIGQALVAASRTVEGRPPHSLHAYFLVGGSRISRAVRWFMVLGGLVIYLGIATLAVLAEAM